MDDFIDKLIEISLRIKQGIKKKDFCIKADHGMGYDSTQLENEYEEAVSRITNLLKNNNRYITNDFLKKIGIVKNNVYPAYDSFRERTPACGGDYTDIDSPIKSDTEWLVSEIQSAQRNLKKTDEVYFNQLNTDLLL